MRHVEARHGPHSRALVRGLIACGLEEINADLAVPLHSPSPPSPLPLPSTLPLSHPPAPAAPASLCLPLSTPHPHVHNAHAQHNQTNCNCIAWPTRGFIKTYSGQLSPPCQECRHNIGCFGWVQGLAGTLPCLGCRKRIEAHRRRAVLSPEGPQSPPTTHLRGSACKSLCPSGVGALGTRARDAGARRRGMREDVLGRPRCSRRATRGAARGTGGPCGVFPEQSDH